MNRILGQIALKVLLIPYIGRRFEKLVWLYTATRFKKGPDTFKGETEFHGILSSGVLDIKEALSEADTTALEKLVEMVLKENMTIVEVGSWKGYSTAVLAKAVANYNGKVFAVDHWMGTERTWNYDVAKDNDIYSIFRHNMIVLGVWDIVHPLVMDSQTASQIFADGIVDLVFIDADHHYESVKKDISAWLPKLRNGGILCGHDCEGFYSEYPEEIKKMIDEHLGDDYIAGIHPGVVKAVHEYLPGQYSLMPTRVWYYIKKDTDSTC